MFCKVLFSFLILSLNGISHQGHSQSRIVDFKLISNHIYLDGKVNSSKIDSLIFDTGASGLILDSSFFFNSSIQFDSLKLTTLFGVGEGGRTAISHTAFGHFIFEFNHIRKEYNSLRVTNLKTIIGNNVQGILGIDGFDNQILEINFPNQTIRFLEDNQMILHYHKIKSTFHSNRFYIIASINSPYLQANLDYRLMLDLGSRYGVTVFNTATINKVNFDSLPERLSTGFSGQARCKIDTGSISIGSSFWRQTTISFYPGKKRFAGINSGLIGTDFFKTDILVIDLKKKNIYIK